MQNAGPLIAKVQSFLVCCICVKRLAFKLNRPHVIFKKQIILSLVLLSGTMVYSHKERFPDSTDTMRQPKQHTHILYQVDFETSSLPSYLTTQSSTTHALKIVAKPVYQGKKA